MEKIVFIVHTEYHLMETIGYITHYFPDTLYNIEIWILGCDNYWRIKTSNLNFKSFNIKVNYATYKSNSYFSLHNKRFLDKIINSNPNILFIFTEFHFWKQYLVSKLHNKGCRIILAPDGANVYSDKQNTFKSNFKYLLKFFLINLTNLTFPPLIINRGKYTYAYLNDIDEVWVDNVIAFKNRNNHIVKETLSFGNNDSLLNIKKVFGVDNLKTIENSILYIDQPVDEKSLLYEIIDVINHVSIKNNFHVYVKMHPRSNQDIVNIYKQHGYTILPDDLPAELYIKNLKNSIVLSLFSTSLFLENTTCRFYWIYPIFDIYRDKLKLANPTNHISIVNNKSEII